MEFTSGRIGGFRLNAELYELPEVPNVYGTVDGQRSKLEIAIKFYELGWSVRKSSWTDYEVESEWAQLSIYGEEEIMLGGIVDESKFGEVGKLLEAFGFRYSLELYDSGKQLKLLLSNT